MAHRLALLLIPVLLTAACGGGTVTSGGGAPEVDGRSYLSTGVTLDGLDRPLVPGTVVRLGFADGAISANAGCNTMGGKVTFDGARMAIAGGLASTEMACPEELMAQDAWLAALLMAGADITVRDDRLTLVSAGTEIAMQDVQTAVPDAPLVMTEWVLDTVVEGDVASSVPAGVTATLAFGSGVPKAFVETGCNTGSGDVDYDATTMTFGPLALTKRACADASAAAVEAAVTAVLQGQVAYVLEGRQLTVTKGDEALVYRAP
jgi:heat shock protein HslJ